VNLLTSSKVFDFVFTETVCFPQMIENGLWLDTTTKSELPTAGNLTLYNESDLQLANQKMDSFRWSNDYEISVILLEREDNTIPVGLNLFPGKIKLRKFPWN
jgi:hypothetical protein